MNNQAKILRFLSTDRIKYNKNIESINYNLLDYGYKLNKSVVFEKGRVISAIYSSDHDGNDVIIEVDIVYVDNADGSIDRTTTRSWLDYSNNVVASSSRPKHYNPTEAKKEGLKRRQNIIDGIISAGMEMGLTAEMKQISDLYAKEIDSFLKYGDGDFKSAIEYIDEDWLAQNIREFINSELDV